MFDRSRANRRLLATMAALAALQLASGRNPSASDSGVLLADFGITGAALVVSAALNFLGGLFRGRVDPNVKIALEGVRTTIADIGRAIVDGLAWVGGKLAAVLLSVKRFIQRTFGPLFDMLRKLVQRVSRILDRILGPIIDFLDKVRDHVWAIYRDFIKPVLDIIEFVRLPLRILSAFGVDWAKRLDAKLAEVEDWIADNFRMVIGKLNQAIDILNDVVDVNRLLKRVTLMRSLLRDVRFVNNLWWNSQMRAGPTSVDPGNPADREFVSGEQITREHIRLIAAGDGPLAAAVLEWAADLSIQLRSARGTI